MRLNKHRMLTVILSCLFFMACAGPAITLKEDTVYEQRIPEMTDLYLLGPGDDIEIVYYIDSKIRDQEYTLAVGDIIDIEFYYHPDMNRRITIRPDGRITVPLKGDIDAAGRTPGQLAEKLTATYRGTLKDPIVTVALVEFDQAAKQLKDAITTDARGQSKVVGVRPDGYITFPFLEDIKAVGLTLPQLTSKVAAEYRKKMDNLSVSLALQETRNNLVYVMGEVEKGNYYLMEGPTTVTQILAMAGGHLDTARMDSILVVSRSKEGKAVGRLVNLEKILGGGNIGHDILLRQYDVVYVPKSRIAKAGQFVDEYINQLIPDVFRVTFGFHLYREELD